ncbi:Lar family restriction alleviation protein [Aeromonas veronii]|uniref:Lar family restriction alleviation protein n=1 Tax=Aeromonas veronii TaxID=654 RepID=UPI00398D4207
MEAKNIHLCPFCARSASLLIVEPPSDEVTRRGFGNYLRVFVKCGSCGASGSPVDGKVDDNGLPAHFVDDAITKWNTRSPI